MTLLIKDIDLLAMDGKEKDVINTNIYIKNDKIYHIGKILDNIEVSRVISGKNKLAMPGLVNAHTHLGMSLLRNYADDMPLQKWLQDAIWPIEAKLTSKDIYWGSLLSMVEMIQSGTTAFCDMYFSMEQVAQGVIDSGMRGVLTRGLIEDPDNPQEKLQETKDLYKEFHGQANNRLKVMVAPHAPYTCSSEYLIKTKNLAEELNTGIHIHLSETKSEVKESFKLHGKSPIQYVNDLGLLDLHTIAAHCVHIDDKDIAILKEKNVYPVNNPGSNLKLASGFAPVEAMMKKGITVALGTDGASSNNNLNMFKEINLASLINKAVNADATSIPAYSAIKMATLNGAKALDWSEEIGTIEVGKQADIILLDMDKPHLYPKHNIISAISYSTQASDVDTVMIDRKIIMENREMKALDVEKIKYMAEKQTRELILR